jgi:hypothetical protein
MLLLPLRANRLSGCGVRTRSAPERLHHEVTDIFTTALPMRASAIELARWGTGDIGVLGWCQRPKDRRSTVRSIRYLHHQRRLSRCDAANRSENFVAALSTRRRLRTPRSSLCHRCPAHRLVPSGRPRALEHARFRASPGIRVSRSGLRRAIQMSRASDNKKPSGAAGSGGSV